MILLVAQACGRALDHGESPFAFEQALRRSRIRWIQRQPRFGGSRFDRHVDGVSAAFQGAIVLASIREPVPKSGHQPVAESPTRRIHGQEIAALQDAREVVLHEVGGLMAAETGAPREGVERIPVSACEVLERRSSARRLRTSRVEHDRPARGEESRVAAGCKAHRSPSGPGSCAGSHSGGVGAESIDSAMLGASRWGSLASATGSICGDTSSRASPDPSHIVSTNASGNAIQKMRARMLQRTAERNA